MRESYLGRYLTPISGDVRGVATVIMLFGLWFCYLTLPNDEPLEIFRYGAYAVGVTLAIAFLVESLQGWKTLLQPDSVAILTFYFLTYAEFLSPNLRAGRLISTEEAIGASELVMLSFAGLAIGRHLPIFGDRLARVDLPELPPVTIYRFFLLFSVLGYLYVLVSVHFDVIEIVYTMLNPRFDTPWQRGRLGNWSALLEELNLLLYAVAAIGGYIYANRHLFNLLQGVIVGIILLFTFCFDVATGTRNVVVIQVGLFLTAYLLSSRKPINLKIVVAVAATLAGLWVAIGFMIEYRNVGFGAVFDDYVNPNTIDARHTMIDNNMYSIAATMGVFPRYYDYPGLDVLWTSIIHPIPRAIWPGKPVDWGISIEEALNQKGGTIAVTYAGEAYLIAGYATAFVASVLFGALAAAWGRVGAAVRTNTGLIYYVSGFYAVTLGMRSMQWITVAILPTIAIYFLTRALRRSGRRRVIMGDGSRRDWIRR